MVCGRSPNPGGSSLASLLSLFVVTMPLLSSWSIWTALAFHHQPSPVQQHCCFATIKHRRPNNGATRFFSTSNNSLIGGRTNSIRLYGRRKHARTIVIEDEEQVIVSDPVVTVEEHTVQCRRRREDDSICTAPDDGLLSSSNTALMVASTLAALAVGAQHAWAIDKAVMSQGPLDPTTFSPVCPTSDGFYRLLQGATEAVVGPEAFVQYGPLIAGGLLRVRLELCVVESFVNEAVVPFVQKNGLNWILPLHETVETFLAGVIFALATTFILIGSTKILTVIVTYTDFLLGLPSRVLGGFVFDRASGKPVTLDVGFGPLKTRLIGPPVKEGGDEETEEFDFSKLGIVRTIAVIISGAIRALGIAVGFVRDCLDGLDFFVGKYLFFWASFYILIKFVHFKVFPDFP